MSVDPDIQKAIEVIDQKIMSLQQARNQLAQAFGIEQSAQVKNGTSSIVFPTPIPAPPAQPQNGADLSKPRKVALAEFLIKNGPMSRVDIVDKAGLPEGTISYCLNDKRFFHQLENGDWDATEFSRRGFELKSAFGLVKQQDSAK